MMLSIALIIMLWAFPAFAVDVTVTWTTNNEPDLAGCKVYVGPASGVYTWPGSPFDVPGANCTTMRVTGLPEGQRYFFAVTAYDKVGNESVKSNEVSKLLDPAVIQPKLTALAVDVDGATVTISGTATKLRYFDDLTIATELKDFVSGATTYRLVKRWPLGTTFVCFEPQASDGSWNTANRLCKPVVPAQPADTIAPAAPIIQSVH